MKRFKKILRFTVLLLTAALVGAGAGSQQGVWANTAAEPAGAGYMSNNANALLKPPNTASPRATLQSFIANMNRAHGLLMQAHRENLNAPGFVSPESARLLEKLATELFESSVECLNLSEVPKNLQKNVGYESAIMLKEVFDRITLPPFEEIPDEEAIDAEKDKEKKAELIRWRIPYSDIIIDRVKQSTREGEFLFTPETVARIEEFYNKVKDYPYKPDTIVSKGFYNFYTTTAGRLVPPKWGQWLPAWSKITYLDQTLWQWFALVVLPLGVLLLVRKLVQWWYRRSADLSSGKKTIGWLLVVILTVAIVSLIKYILDEHVNITGVVVVYVEKTLQRIFILLLVGLILWEFIKAQIKKTMEEEVFEQDSSSEEGGAGGSRSQTLLLLMRKTLVFVMFAVVVLLILSSMGINIAPLLAGAGVVGLAIGFGAQTLVQDIIAGIFFLIDDAFRVGDYIEIGEHRGTVEHISLRSLRLRSARGPVHTIPFGSMGTVTNNSRDYIISKLDFRVRYDTDVDKVRKIIKKINAVIAQDEEMGPVMLDKIKSQGVRELDDSAMIMRVKFKTIPGEQFVVRREVFRMMQEAFRENGIEFAHRNVTVYLPPEEDTGQPDKRVIEAGAAAAVAAEQAEAQQKQKP